jgi:SAM-dependent methyltransferase
MFSWYREQVREYGVATATLMLARAARSVASARLANKLLPSRVACPCCGWEGRKFYDYVEAGYTARGEACPRCDSHARHRALFLWLRDEFRIKERTGSALVCAPEPALAALWDAAVGLEVCRLDISPARGVDVLADLQRLPFAGESFDIAWCHHVLEQVEDDRAALGELRRVLRASGTLVVSAGMSAEARTREFGFSDRNLSGNRRQYGQDFPARLAEAGFEVAPVRHGLSEADLRRYGVRSFDRAYACSVTPNDP